MDLLNKLKIKATVALEAASGSEIEKRVKAATSVCHHVRFISHLNKLQPETYQTVTSTVKRELGAETRTYDGFREIMPVLWERLLENDSAIVKMKCLELLDGLLQFGSDRIRDDALEHQYELRSLQHFQCVEDNIDRGAVIRKKAKFIDALLTDSATLEQHRRDGQKLSMNASVSSLSSGTGFGSSGSRESIESREMIGSRGFGSQSFGSTSFVSQSSQSYGVDSVSSNPEPRLTVSSSDRPKIQVKLRERSEPQFQVEKQPSASEPPKTSSLIDFDLLSFSGQTVAPVEQSSQAKRTDDFGDFFSSAPPQSQSVESEWANFQTAPSSTAPAAPTTTQPRTASSDFDAFFTAPAQQQNDFGAFASAPTRQQQDDEFSAFASSAPKQSAPAKSSMDSLVDLDAFMGKAPVAKPSGQGPAFVYRK